MSFKALNIVNVTEHAAMNNNYCIFIHGYFIDHRGLETRPKSVFYMFLFSLRTFTVTKLSYSTTAFMKGQYHEMRMCEIHI